MSSLPDLITQLKEIEDTEKHAESEGQSMPEELYFEKEIVKSLIQGRVDQAAELRSAVTSRIEALQEALERANRLKERTENAFIAAIAASGKDRLDGLAWSAKMQTNGGRASVIIDDEKQIPRPYWIMEVAIVKKFPGDDKASHHRWANIVVGRDPGCQDDFSPEQIAEIRKSCTLRVSKTEVEKSLKTDPKAVPGAHLERGKHLRIAKGEAQTKALPKE